MIGEIWVHFRSGSMDDDCVWYGKPAPNRTAFPGETRFVEAKLHESALWWIRFLCERSNVSEDETERIIRVVSPQKE